MIGERRQRAAAELVVQLARALEQPGVQIEDVAREGLAARRPAEEQRELAVGIGLLGQVVVDDKRVLALVEEVLAHRGAGERRHPLDRRGLVGGRRHDRRVRHRAGLAQPLVHLGDGRGLLADGDVDALHVLVVLVQDRVDGDRRLAGRTVADDQLALAAADVRHRVDRLDPGLERLLHRLAVDDARRLPLERARLLGVDRALAVERVSERVDDAAKECLTDRNRRDLAGAAHGIALADLVPLAEERDADVVLLEVEREADDAVVELEHLERDAVLEPVDAGDAVAELQDGTDLGEVRVDVELLDPLAEDRRDLFGTQLHCGLLLLGVCELLTEAIETAADAGVEAHRACLQDETADQLRIDAPRRLHLAARLLLDVGDDAVEVGVGERLGRGELDVEHAGLGADERLELGRDLADLGGAALLDDEVGEVADEVVRAVEDLLEHLRLHRPLGLGVDEQGLQRGHLVDRLREIAELLANGREPALALRGLEESAGVDALRAAMSGSPPAG